MNHPVLSAALDRLLPSVIRWRRHLHRNPELSYREHRTAAFVHGKLRAFGIPARTGIGGCGVIGTIDGAGEGPLSPCGPIWTPCPSRMRRRVTTAHGARA